jgi:hypothetical protein
LFGHRNLEIAAMTRLFILAFAATLARALLAHSLAEVFRMILEYVLPGAPLLVYLAIGLLLGVAVVEVAEMLWHRRS